MKKKKLPGSEVSGEMTFWEHLDELRGTLWRIVIACLLASTITFVFKEVLFDYILLAPKSSNFITYRVLCSIGQWISMPSLCIDPSRFNLINITLAGQFLSHMNLSLVAGLIIVTPYILWELWHFIKPGLTEKEIKYSRGGVFITSLLFLTGVFFSYFIVAPLMINFLGGYEVSPSVSNQISLTSYVSSVTLMTLLIGLLFELPVLIIFLTRIGIITPKRLKKSRKYIIVLILLIAGIITPSPDIFSQLIIAVPIYSLFELSIVISGRIHKKIRELNNRLDG
jgi:sec-independent protein translocase protein TatC